MWKIHCASYLLSGLGVYTYAVVPQEGNLHSPPRRADAQSAAFAEQK